MRRIIINRIFPWRRFATRRPSFASDNNAGIHPHVMSTLCSVNAEGDCMSYGCDENTNVAMMDVMRKHFGNDSYVYPVLSGTASNVLALSCVMKSYESVITSSNAHIANDECNAVEKFVGCKGVRKKLWLLSFIFLLGSQTTVVPVVTSNGKLTPDLVRPYLHGVGSVHNAQPRVISISQSTEMGTVYSVDEILSLSNFAHAHGMLLHMDGARLSNGCASLALPLCAVTRDVGVDLLSFGLTKNGAMNAEALIHWNSEWATCTPYLRKQMGQLFSKMRYSSSQFVAMLQGDLWIRNAMRANELAQYLAAELSQFGGICVTQPTQANAVFATIADKQVTQKLLEHYFFYVWNEATQEVRFMTHWNHTREDCDAFLALLTHLLAESSPPPAPPASSS